MKFERSETVFSNKTITLHRFSRGYQGTPAFILPPYAGRHGNVAQRMCDRLALERDTYAYELHPATQYEYPVKISDLLGMLVDCIDVIKKETGYRKVDLIGLCQGGWLAAMLTALDQQDINRLAVFASPINTHTGEENIIERYCQSASIEWHKLVVALHGGVQPGYMQWLAFCCADLPGTFFNEYSKLLDIMAAGNSGKFDKWMKVNTWLHSPQNLGAWFIEAMESHFIGNELYNGTWRVGTQIADLTNITCPVRAYSGADDKITHTAQVDGLLDKVSSKDKLHTIFEETGHTAVFAGGWQVERFVEDFYPAEFKLAVNC